MLFMMTNKPFTPETRQRLLAVGAMLGALVASSCCVLPLLLAALGVGGAWVGFLPLLAPYSPLFFVLSSTCIAVGFWTILRRRRMVCEGAACGTPASRRLTQAALWAGLVILTAAASADWWARLLD
jgi:mercuric ion transport protein